MIYDAKRQMMSTPITSLDIVTVWPRGIDYPLYRQFIKQNRSQFNKVIIVFTESWNGNDFRDWIKKDMSDCVFMDSPNEAGDWRNIATNTALTVSDSSDILFLEQDFMILNPSEFFRIMKNGYFQMVCYREGARLHPAMIRVQSAIVKVTSRNFAVDPGVSDHFFGFFKDIEQLQIPIEIMVMEDKDCRHIFYHLAGFTHNYNLCIANDLKNIYKPQEFREWNKKSLEADVEQNSTFKNTMEMVDRQMQELKHDR